MIEKFNMKSRGDLLSAEEVNHVFRSLIKLTSQTPGSYAAGAGSFPATSTQPPWTQATVEITSDEILNEDTYSGTYWCKLRYWDPNELTWKSQSQEYILDASDYGNRWAAPYGTGGDPPTRMALLLVGDRISAWWNAQRGAFVPLTAPMVNRWAKLDYDLSGFWVSELGVGNGGRSYATIWTRPWTSTYNWTNTQDWEATDIKVRVYAPPFMAADETIDAGNWVGISSFAPEYVWYVIAVGGQVLSECTTV